MDELIRYVLEIWQQLSFDWKLSEKEIYSSEFENNSNYICWSNKISTWRLN